MSRKRAVAAAREKAKVARAKANVEVRQRELETARARLIGPETLTTPSDEASGCCINVRSPVSGQLLKRIQSSETVIAPGAPLVEIGNTADMEIVVELLSTDAVKVAENASARIDGWGGQRPLSARLRRIEPAGFTKVSALGIEEQRVNVIVGFDPAEAGKAARLGHGYQIDATVILWSAKDVLRPFSRVMLSLQSLRLQQPQRECR